MWRLREGKGDVIGKPRRPPESTLYRAAAGGLQLGAALTLLSSVLSPETTGTPLQAAVATPLYYPTATVGVTLVVLCLPALFLRLRQGKGAAPALCGTLLIVAAGMGLAFGLGFAAGLGIPSRLGFITLLALPWSVMLPLPQLGIDGGPALPNVFFILFTAVVGLGGVLLGVATLRARALGCAAGVALISCTVLSVIVGFLPLPGMLNGGGEAVYMSGLVCAGVALWRASTPASSDVTARRDQAVPIG